MPLRPCPDCLREGVRGFARAGSSRCGEHERKRERERSRRRREATRGIFKRKRWRMVRKAKLGRLCEDGRVCGGDGFVEEVDHIRPLADFPDQDPYSLSGTQGICFACHRAKTAEENRRRQAPG